MHNAAYKSSEFIENEPTFTDFKVFLELTSLLLKVSSSRRAPPPKGVKFQVAIPKP
jgi:hypothetical protein